MKGIKTNLVKYLFDRVGRESVAELLGEQIPRLSSVVGKIFIYF